MPARGKLPCDGGGRRLPETVCLTIRLAAVFILDFEKKGEEKLLMRKICSCDCVDFQFRLLVWKRVYVIKKTRNRLPMLDLEAF